MLTKDEKHIVRKDIGRTSRFALIYALILSVVAIVVAVGIAMPHLSGDAAVSPAELQKVMTQRSGELSLIALAVGTLFVLLKRRGKLFSEDLRNPDPHPMSVKVLLACAVLFMGFQALSSGIDPIIKWIAENLGFSLSTTTDALGEMPVTPYLLLYVGILGPIMEEVVFRGVVMNSFRKYGKGFAIVTSAFLFGIFHGDFNQGLFAFACGLVFGYVAMEYSIKWSMVLHIFNNFVLANVLGQITGMFSEDIQTILWFVIFAGIGGLGGLIILLCKRKAIGNYLRENRSAKGTVAACWTTPSYLLFIVVELMMMVQAFSKMG